MSMEVPIITNAMGVGVGGCACVCDTEECISVH